MSKNKGKQYATREEWLAVRSSPSLGRTLRNLERYKHAHQIDRIEREDGSSFYQITPRQYTPNKPKKEATQNV